MISYYNMKPAPEYGIYRVYIVRTFNIYAYYIVLSTARLRACTVKRRCTPYACASRVEP